MIYRISSVQTCLSSGLAQKPLNIKTGELEESSQRQIIINIHFPPGEQAGAAVPDVPGQNPAGHFDPGHGECLEYMYLYYGQCVPGIVLWTCVFWWYGWIVYCDDDQDGHPYAISLAITDCVISLRWETDGTKTNLLCTRMLVFLALHVFLLSFEWITILSFCLNRSYWLSLNIYWFITVQKRFMELFILFVQFTRLKCSFDNKQGGDLVATGVPPSHPSYGNYFS